MTQVVFTIGDLEALMKVSRRTVWRRLTKAGVTPRGGRITLADLGRVDARIVTGLAIASEAKSRLLECPHCGETAAIADFL